MKITSNNVRRVLFVVAVLTCLTPWVSAPIALIGGFLFTLLFGHPFPETSSKVTSMLLKGSVIGLGFGMNVDSAVRTGGEGAILTISSIIIVLVVGYFVGKKLGVTRKISHLISSGTAICGGSAIAAVAPSVNASEEDISISLGVVFLLNSVALIIFPPLGHLSDMSQHQFGLWCAIAIHDTSSVVGAASVFGDEALNTAVMVKLVRALWIIPLAIVSVMMFHSKDKKISVPWFIGFFILAMVANSYLDIPKSFTETIVLFAKRALVLALFLVGSSLSIQKLRSVGLKPLILGVVLWVIITIFSFTVIYFL